LGYVGSNIGSLAEHVRTLLGVMSDLETTAQDEPGTTAAAFWQRIGTQLDIGYVRGDVADLIAETQEGIARVKKIVQDLKEFSHADPQETWAHADLQRGLASTLNIVRNEIRYKATIEEAYGELPMVYCVMSQLNQVFMNMLVNAGQAVGENGRIRIATGVQGDRVWIEIADNGAGIAPEHLEHIFDPFFTTKPVGVGTGLGLSLSYSIVQKHHGTIDVETAPGAGTTFRIWLPTTAADHAAMAVRT
jgi:signal transduction histidine kinase